ncbi:xanthine dehydrogenase family protein molybdopterin-binding subunit, partial [Falsiroseomonas oryzae]|uniref:xanthine dehydrogenase family protein molybdopterin-binding subunit n=1 Tax=Falsiroseomonas oryzae TaxID=2766473 RepID=UPI0022EADE6C
MRQEDLRLLTGRGRFLGDALPEGALHAAFVRAPVAHAAIRAINARARGEGVLLVSTVAELDRDGIGPIAADPVRGFLGLDDPAWPTTFQPALARGRVRYVGEPVAMVVARTAAAARDAAEAIEVDYETLAAVADRTAALPDGATPLHDGYPSGRLPITAMGDAEATAAAMATAAHRLRVAVEIPRLAGAALEPRGALAWVGPDGGLVLESGTQRPYQVRETLARALGLSPAAVRIRFDDVGGGFGIKNQAYPEQLALLWAARRLGQPVLWRATRSEDMAADAAARDTGFEAEIGLSADGNLLALAVRRTVSLGAYAGPRAVAPAINGLGLVAGPYRWRAAHVAVEGVFTNTAPTTVYRGAGRPETVTFCERAIDAAARAMGEDPVAFRRRHLLRPGETNVLGVALGDADPARVLARAVALHAAPAGAPGRLRGTGVSLYVEDL